MARRVFTAATLLWLIAALAASQEQPSRIGIEATAYEGIQGERVDNGTLRRLIGLAIEADGELCEIQVGRPFAIENQITGELSVHVEGITWSLTGVALPDHKVEFKWDVVESNRNRLLPETVDELKLGSGVRSLKVGEKVTIPLLGSAAVKRWIEVRAIESR